MHPDVMLLLANQRQAELRRAAEVSRVAREARRAPQRPARRPADDAHVTLRLDRVGDSARLYQLSALSERPLPAGPFVVAEVDGRLVAALPLAGGAPLADPFVPTFHLLRLLELRAGQIRRVDVRPRPRRRLLLRRA